MNKELDKRLCTGKKKLKFTDLNLADFYVILQLLSRSLSHSNCFAMICLICVTYISTVWADYFNTFFSSFVMSL